MNNVFTIIIASILVGIAFGFALEKSKVYLPFFIIGQMNFTFFTMLKVFLIAIVTGGFVIALLSCIGYTIEFTVFSYLRSIVGGGLLGIGVALAGACPGTVVVQISAGYKQAMVTILGCFCGAAFYSLNEKKILYLLGTYKPAIKSLYELFSCQAILGFLMGFLILLFFLGSFLNKLKKSNRKTSE